MVSRCCIIFKGIKPIGRNIDDSRNAGDLVSEDDGEDDDELFIS